MGWGGVSSFGRSIVSGGVLPVFGRLCLQVDILAPLVHDSLSLTIEFIGLCGLAKPECFYLGSPLKKAHLLSKHFEIKEDIALVMCTLVLLGVSVI